MPFCALLDARLSALPLRRVFRHFPVRSKHPRAWAAAAAVEAAAQQGAFWAMHDALFADQGRLEDPHLGTELNSWDSTSTNSSKTATRPQPPPKIQNQFDAAIRAGVATTPTHLHPKTDLRRSPNPRAPATSDSD